MEYQRISGIPVVEGNGGKLVGVLTNRDVRFADKADQPVSELMTKENLVTVEEGVDMAEARRLLHNTGSKNCWWSTMTIAVLG